MPKYVAVLFEAFFLRETSGALSNYLLSWKTPVQERGKLVLASTYPVEPKTL